MATVKFRYSASSNISFHGEIDSEIEREDWDAMSEKERQEVFTETVFELVEISEVED